MAKKLSYRCKNERQQKDKATIYNSREWAELRIRKMQANPICEMCEAEGHVAAAQCVHHIHPIEQSSSLQEMRMWAFKWENLQSLCRYHHAKVHREMGSNTKAKVAERAEARQARWKDSLLSRFTTKPTDDEGDQQTSENPAPSF